LALSLALSVCARPASLNVNIVYPAAGTLTGDDLLVVATVSSTLELKEVVAQVEGRESSLLFSSAAYSDQFGVNATKPMWPDGSGRRLVFRLAARSELQVSLQGF
jgi:hypothetical protein